MELFVEYHKLKKDYEKANYKYEDLCDKRDYNAIKPYPGASNPSNEITRGSNNNKFDNCMIKDEELEILIKSSLEEMDNITNQLQLKEYELRKITDKILKMDLSKHEPLKSDILNTIYTLKFIERFKAKYISIKLYYSKTVVYDLINQIYKTLNSQNENKMQKT